LDQLSLPKGYVVAPAKERLALSRRVDFLPLEELLDALRLRPKVSK
jgi:hypothetical protein